MNPLSAGSQEAMSQSGVWFAQDLSGWKLGCILGMIWRVN